MQYLLRTLNAGSLQGQLGDEPIYIKKFGPQLGQDNLRHGLEAAIWSLVFVALIIAVYYFFCGLVADAALFANMVIILGVMAMFGATFTLPGIAGIVLTIGMAVDANVLIFERIREELDRKVDVETAVRLGYEKALSSIVDANITTLITCVVLYYTATAEVKGFAVTLIVGLLATMFTALFCSRVAVDYYLAFGARGLTMLPMKSPTLCRWLYPNVNWVGKARVLMAVSVVLAIGGLTLVISRGEDLLDIEFRSGTAVTFELAKGQTLALDQVRDRLDKVASEANMPLMASEHATVVTVGATQGSEASAFNVAVLETNANAVSDAIKKGFEDVLDAQRPIAFSAMGLENEAASLATAPVHVVRHAPVR